MDTLKALSFKTAKTEKTDLGNRQSIVKRLLARTLSVILVVLIAVQIVAALSVKKYYYSGVERQMETAMIMVRNKFWRNPEELMHKNTNYSQRVRMEIEDFSYKEQMELMGVSLEGKIMITSSGFPVEYSDISAEADFMDAKNSIGGSISPFYVTKIGKEEVMSVSVRIPNPENLMDEPAMIRIVTSLTDVNRQIIYVLALITVMSMVIILLITYSNSYFIKSLVIPVGKVTQTAQKIAMGDFTARLEIENNDEIGDLTRSINNMAAELSKAEEVKNEFISSVSHELRTPLTAIRGWTETLMIPETDPETERRGLNIILSETQRLGNMVEELLDFSRMQSGKFSLMMKKMDIAAELEETQMMFYQRAAREGTEILLDIPEHMPAIMGDASRLRQVFVNLIDNAFKYTDTNGKITLKAREDKEKQEITVFIIDTGTGISKEDIGQVKERFYKGKDARRGSGIGLSVVDEIVTRHGGSFEIESELHKGTTASITLPTYDRWILEHGEKEDFVKEI